MPKFCCRLSSRTLEQSCQRYAVDCILERQSSHVKGQCPGDRQRIPANEGCCPARAGEACGGDVSVYCDTELGYTCLDENGEEGRGVCKGKYDLRGVTIKQKSLTIQWKPFAPPNYTLEYSLMSRIHNYSSNLTLWKTIETGDEAEYTLVDLEPATWYFIKIAVWHIPFNDSYSNITETLMIKTKDAEYCEHAGNEYEIGQTFNNNNEDSCLCLKTGQLDCTSLCPNSSNEACDIRTRGNCSEIECETVMANCSVNGTIYIHNEIFEQGECRECTCSNGEATCILPSHCEEMEATEECPKPVSHIIEGQCCPEWECGSPRLTFCEHRGRRYTEGYEWQDEETCETCECHQGQATCHNFCEEPEMPENCPRPSRRPAPNGCCEIYECLQPVDICVYANGTHKRGSFFTSDHCELCVCNKNMTVECSPSCPEEPPPLPLRPSVICRQPHYRLVNCCKTLFCQRGDNDLMSAIRNVYATSHTPQSITITFDALRQRTEEEEEELYPDYQLFFSDAEESSNPTNWTPKHIHLTPVEEDESTSPSLLFQKMDSFLVGTLTCIINGRVLNEEESYLDECERDCICRAGKLACENNCPQINTIMMPSSSCPQPKLEKKENECCPSWKCHPKPSGCRYGTALLKDGEQVREGCDNICTCESGRMQCRPVCNITSEPPRQGCRLQQIPDHCCKAWMCPPDKRPVKSVEAVVRTIFNRNCLEPINQFKNSFREELLGLVHSSCKRLNEHERTICLEIDTVMHCSTTRSRRRRDVDATIVDFGVSVPRRSDESLASLNNSLQTILDDLSSLFNTSESVVLNIDSVEFTSSGQLILKSLHYACDEGYSFYRDFCVRTEILIREPAFSLELQPLSVGADTAVLGWESLTKIGVTYVIALQIEYREDNYTAWNQTTKFQPHETSHTLTELQAESIYRARLVALTNLGTRPMVPTRDLVFKTKAYEGEFSLYLENVQVGQTSVTIRWRNIPKDELANIQMMEITYNEINRPLTVNTVTTKPSLNKYTIPSLKQATNYVAVITIVFNNGTRVQSGTIHFITDSSDKSSNLTIPLAVSAVILVCAIIIVSITCCMWRKARLKNITDTAFENKVFGIQIQNEGRTLSARP
ncbi:hypothetical protein LOTGIDRAFT_238038 [Lottia gigantea]|uniref:Fibronectin type-III domain-containing protein n=1 Tax=Lottia gigantea TaxID=225164 RepID=V4B4B0_LOTGI|nr:hypothetical protein LOTGIDRAFT_238038 [Lottia gigantea]ESP02311.1 hypothetical protein LOTGIDRAFT_238038 [Lottia gigantea]